MKILSNTAAYKIVLDRLWLLVNDKVWGFTMTSDEGENFIVRHVRQIGVKAKEFGFYVPSPIIKLPMLFEVSRDGVYYHYHYSPKKKARLIRSGHDVFISLSGLAYHAKVAHIEKPQYVARAVGDRSG